MACAFRKFCVLRVSKRQGHRLTFPSGPTLDYSQTLVTVAATGHLVVAVRTCVEARLLLSDSLELGVVVYEVTLGSRSAIRDRTNASTAVDGVNPVDCDETRYFWLSWERDGAQLQVSGGLQWRPATVLVKLQNVRILVKVRVTQKEVTQVEIKVLLKNC